MYRSFVLSTGLAFLLCLIIIFAAVTATNRKLIYEQAKTEARALLTALSSPENGTLFTAEYTWRKKTG